MCQQLFLWDVILQYDRYVYWTSRMLALCAELHAWLYIPVAIFKTLMEDDLWVG